jgi:hypothetical protein
METLELESVGRRLRAESFPRLQMVLILSLAGIGAFLASVTLLHFGVGSMATRYFLAAAFGYLLFLALVRAWLAYQRDRWSPDADIPTDGSSADTPEPPPFAGEGGSFGGGGASGSFESAGAPAPLPAADGATLPGASSDAGVLDGIAGGLDEGWPVALALAALGAGILALGFVVHASPILFAEVLLNAAVAGVVYRRARRHGQSPWIHGVVRRTWIPALALCAFVTLAGFAVQRSAPDARSLGAALSRALD